MLEFENFGITNIVTAVDVNTYEGMLKAFNYDKEKTNYLVHGFRNGFDLHYEGPLSNTCREAPNLKLHVGSQVEMWNKIMVEVKAGCYAGPFKGKPPFKHYVQSPVGLVPKDKGRKTRLIFHLSYPKTGHSVNSGIPKAKTSVKYPDFTEAIKLCIAAGVKANCAKNDMSMAFCNMLLSRHTWALLVIKISHLVSKEIMYFFDKCLPFGSSISCKIFQDFSDSITHLVHFRTHQPLVNYLDDYFFISLLKKQCDSLVQVFLTIL